MLTKYVMTSKRLKRFRTQYGEVKCKVCGVNFEEGDSVLSKPLNGKAKRVHETCRPANW